MPEISSSNQAASHTRSTVDLPAQLREASFVPGSWNAETASCTLVWTTGAQRRAYDWMSDTLYDEELQVDADAVDMTRFEAGTVQVLDGHRAYGGTGAILGIAARGWVADGQGHADIRLRTSTPQLAAVAADVGAGLIRAVSFGYSVQRYEITPAHMRTDGGTVPLYRATRWTPQEISFVAVPADPHAGTRSQQTAQASSTASPCELVRAIAQPQATLEHPTMPANLNQAADDQTRQQAAATAAQSDTQSVAVAVLDATALAAEAATRAADITELCARHGVADLAAGLIRKQSTVDQARAAILEQIAVRDAAQGGHTNVRSVRTERDETETKLRGMEGAVMHRMDSRAQLDDNARQFRGLSLLEMGREYLESRGVSTRGMDRMRLASEMLHFRSPGMHTTSDFSTLMSNVANKRLRGAYEENPGTYALWARRAPNASDFKNITVAQISAMPDLQRVNEHGEFKYGAMKDGGEVYAVFTSGTIVSLSRQSIVNDDLRSFDRMVEGYGRAARRFENRTVYSILTANAAMADGVALFSAASGARLQANIQTGAGSALQLSSLAAGRTSMRKMKGLQNEELNLAPAYLIVPSDLEQTAYQLTSANYVPATPAATNEFRSGGRTAVMPIVEPVLDGTSATQWYLAASSGQVDTVEYCYLDGAEGPVIESEPGFEVDGVSYKCRLDFGAKAIDHRGLHRSAGA